MKKHMLKICCVCLYIVITSTLSASNLFSQSVNAEDKAIRALVNHFYDGWNTHDVERMVSVYDDSIEHINAFGIWGSGKPRVKQDLIEFHAGPGKNNPRKTITFEKIKFISPNVAVAIVRQISAVGNLGMFVLSKASGKWLVVSFANVPFKLGETEAKSDEKKQE